MNILKQNDFDEWSAIDASLDSIELLVTHFCFAHAIEPEIMNIK